MRLLLALALLPACTWVGPDDWEKANDRDGDGFLAEANGGDDCDDGDAAVHPGADESCNDRDDDCDGDIDEDPDDAPSWYPDSDGDSYGDRDAPVASCTAPSGYLADGTDCDDGDATIHPGAEETCDEVDQDCDGTIDNDATDASSWYVDDDGDGYGVPLDPLAACEQPDGYAPNADDCDDSRDDVHPGAPELCDGDDNDCDELADDLEASSSARWSLYGTQGYARAGEGSQGRADYDGDGHADLVVGLPGADTEGHTGLVGLWWGGELALEGQQSSDDWSPDLLIVGGDGAELTWVQRSWAALNGEDASLALSVQQSASSACHLFFGEDLAGTEPLGSEDASVVLQGCGAGESWRLAYGGDLDDDGYDDLPVLASSYAGAMVLAGRADSRWNGIDNKLASDHAELFVDAAAPGDPLVVSLEGDLDGDGCDELLLGDPAYSSYATDGGAVFLLYGDTTALDDGVTRPLPEGADAVLLGQSPQSQLGQAVTAADLDGDGYAELLVSAVGSAARSVFLVPGGTERLTGSVTPSSAGAYGWTVSPESPSPGWGLSAGEDVDGDSTAEVLIASAAVDGALVWVVSGTDAFGGLDLDADATIVTGLSEPRASSLAADLNGDGSGELLLANPTDAEHAVNSGALHLLFGYR